jgi:hypothetical protein
VLKVIGNANPTLLIVPSASAWIDAMSAETLVALGQDGEALKALERARTAREILVKDNPAITRNHEQLIRVHRQAADIHCRAGRMSEALAALESTRQIASGLAHAHPDEEAMISLRSAIAAGWRDAASMKTDTDLVPIRSRPDFPALLLDAAFPADPFVRGN